MDLGLAQRRVDLQDSTALKFYMARQSGDGPVPLKRIHEGVVWPQLFNDVEGLVIVDQIGGSAHLAVHGVQVVHGVLCGPSCGASHTQILKLKSVFEAAIRRVLKCMFRDHKSYNGSQGTLL